MKSARIGCRSWGRRRPRRESRCRPRTLRRCTPGRSWRYSRSRQFPGRTPGDSRWRKRRSAKTGRPGKSRPGSGGCCPGAGWLTRRPHPSRPTRALGRPSREAPERGPRDAHSSKAHAYRSRCGTYALPSWLRVKVVSGLNNRHPLRHSSLPEFPFTGCCLVGSHRFLLGSAPYDNARRLSTGPWYRWILVHKIAGSRGWRPASARRVDKRLSRPLRGLFVSGRRSLRGSIHRVLPEPACVRRFGVPSPRTCGGSRRLLRRPAELAM